MKGQSSRDAGEMKECVNVQANIAAIHILKVCPAAIHDFVQGNRRTGENMYQFHVGTARPKRLDEALA